MVKYKKFQSQPKPLEALYDPFALIEISVGSMSVLARPFEFDSEPVGHDFLNAAGRNVKPTKFNTTCPHCGQQIIFEAAKLGTTKSIVCPECQVGIQKPPEPLVDPFQNPFEAGLIQYAELDIDVGNAGKPIVPDQFKTAAERIEARKKRK